MLSKEIVRVLFNADMEIRVGEGGGTVQAGMKFISVLQLTYRKIPLIRPPFIIPPPNIRPSNFPHALNGQNLLSVRKVFSQCSLSKL